MGLRKGQTMPEAHRQAISKSVLSKRPILICIACGKSYSVAPNKAKVSKYCSNRCSNNRYGVDLETGARLCERGHVKNPKYRQCQECEKLRHINKKLDFLATDEGKLHEQKMQARRDKIKRRKELYDGSYYKQMRAEGTMTDAYMERMARHSKNKHEKHRKLITDTYIRIACKLPMAMMIPELLEIKRLKLQLWRTIKCQNLQQAA